MSKSSNVNRGVPTQAVDGKHTVAKRLREKTVAAIFSASIRQTLLQQKRSLPSFAMAHAIAIRQSAQRLPWDPEYRLAISEKRR